MTVIWEWHCRINKCLIIFIRCLFKLWLLDKNLHCFSFGAKSFISYWTHYSCAKSLVARVWKFIASEGRRPTTIFIIYWWYKYQIRYYCTLFSWNLIRLSFNLWNFFFYKSAKLSSSTIKQRSNSNICFLWNCIAGVINSGRFLK